MKTTIDISDSLLRRAKRLAARRGLTLRAIVEQALDRELSVEESVSKSPLRTHTFKGHGLQPGLSWSDWSALQSMSYEGRGG